MSVRKRVWRKGNGEESVRWTVDVTGADGHRERRQFTTRKEADAFRVQVEGQITDDDLSSRIVVITQLAEELDRNTLDLALRIVPVEWWQARLGATEGVEP